MRSILVEYFLIITKGENMYILNKIEERIAQLKDEILSDKEFFETIEKDLGVIAEKAEREYNIIEYEYPLDPGLKNRIWDIYSDIMIVWNKLRDRIGKEVVAY